MAEQTQSLSGGVTVKYVLTPPDLASIDVKDSSGRTLIYGPTNQNSINVAIAQTNKLLDNTIANAKLDIEIANEEIVQYQAILNDPTSSERSRNRATLGISGNQKDIARANQTITDCNVAKAGINSQGNSILTGLIPKSVAPTPAPIAAPAPAPAAALTKTKLSGAADGDSGAKQANPAGTTGAPPNQKTVTSSATKKPTTNPNVSAPNGPSTPPNATSVPSVDVKQTVASTPDPVQEPQTVDSKPGRRLKNPLGEFASYTYQLSLYMITPDAYDIFVTGGRKKIDLFSEATAGVEGAGGAFLIAQSGGINNTNSKRAPGFDMDYYIDGLELSSVVSGKSSGSATNITGAKFKIIEPYGFSFVTNLKKASDQLAAYSKGTAFPQNATKQFFILGIRFFGYDQSGRLVSGDTVFDGSPLDPNSAEGALFETFYDIAITSINFKIDGKATTYNCEAVALAPAKAFSVTKGKTHVAASVTANTVGGALDQLMEQLNKVQADWKKAGTIDEEIKYSIDWSAPGASEIKDAAIVSPADLDKTKWAGSGAKTTEKASAAKETTVTPKPDFRTIKFKEDTPILEVINQVIAQSMYLENALKVVNTTALEADPKAKSSDSIKPKTNKLISWYNCSTVISNAKWDKKIADWAYDITYRIQKYETPAVNSAYANPGKNYYGPHKRYSYWYTGKNSEILQYEQTLDNAYFASIAQPLDTDAASDGGTNPTGAATKPAAGTSGNATNGPTDVARAPGIRTNQPRLGSLGDRMEAPNNYITSLYDPASFAQAKIKIMGDPDFLVQESESKEAQIYNRYYGTNGFTVNPNGGQVFIEIDFKEAVDYGTDGDLDNNTGGGTLKINDSILFWKYPNKVIDDIVEGVCYNVLELTSHFSNGSFTQTIEAAIQDFGPEGSDTTDSARPAQPTTSPQAGAAPGNSAAAKGSTGTPQSKSFNTANPALPASNKTNKSPSQPTSKTGPAAKPVADDDGGKG